MFVLSQNAVLSGAAISLVGAATGLGDCVNQGYIKGFRGSVVVGYASGTGLAGLFGGLLYYVAKEFNFDASVVYLILVPFYVMNYFLFKQLVREKMGMG